MRSPEPRFRPIAGIAGRLAFVALAGASLAACQDTNVADNGRSSRPIPSNVLALMQEKGTDAHQPILIRTFKKEAEFEIWKMRADGQYTLLKTYPMCRWSGQLGPKTREGDRQVPEGFYTITPGQMNPNSAYYLSFNVGYPNAYDRVHGYTGGSIMVHGACSSAGCYSMTDDQIAEIYAIAREAFGGGQRAIQMQSLPFRMSAENLAKHRFDPNIKFWKELKTGADQFEVSKQETKVAICSSRYVFGSTPVEGRRIGDAAEACPPMQEDDQLKALVSAKQQQDDARVAELVASGVKPVKLVYADGGQNPEFASKVTELSRPEAVEAGPTEIVIDEKGRPVPTAVQVAAARPAKPEASQQAMARAVTPGAAPAGSAGAPVAFAAATPPAADQPFYKKWLGFSEPAAASTSEPEPAATMTDGKPVPVPPRRQVGNAGDKATGDKSAADRNKPQAALEPVPAPASPAAESRSILAGLTDLTGLFR